MRNSPEFFRGACHGVYYRRKRACSCRTDAKEGRDGRERGQRSQEKKQNGAGRRRDVNHPPWFSCTKPLSTLPHSFIPCRPRCHQLRRRLSPLHSLPPSFLPSSTPSLPAPFPSFQHVVEGPREGVATVDLCERQGRRRTK